MDRDGGRYRGVDSHSSGSDVHETSFMTASDGSESHMDPEQPPRSSRSMPLPEHMRRKSEENLHVEESVPLQTTDGTDDGIAPPPSYNEVVSHPGVFDGSGAGDERNDNADQLTVDDIAVIEREREKRESLNGATGHDLNHRHDDIDQVPDIRSRQSDRDKYLPSSDRRHEIEEAIAMDLKHYRISGLSPEIPKETPVTGPELSSAPPPRVIEQMHMEDVEDGRQREEDTCSGFGPLQEPMERFCRFLRRQSRNRLILFGILGIAIVGLLLFLSLFPASFVYIDYHEIALKQSRMTNVVDREHVYYHGSYVLGPDTKLVKFDASVQNVIEEIGMFTLDTITLSIRYSVHYFIRPQEVGKIYTQFMYDYDKVFRLIIQSSLRNLAGTSLTVDNFRFNRTYVETQMHAMLRKRLGGDCCPACCDARPRLCQSNAYCSTCKRGNCDQGYHVDVRYFNLLSVSIPDEVFEKLLLRTLMKVNDEKEFFIQDHALAEKETSLQVQNIKNEANEVYEAGKHEASKLNTIAEAEHENIVQTAYIQGLKGFFTQLNVTLEEDQRSLMLIRALEDCVDNLHVGYGYANHTLFTP